MRCGQRSMQLFAPHLGNSLAPSAHVRVLPVNSRPFTPSPVSLRLPSSSQRLHSTRALAQGAGSEVQSDVTAATQLLPLQHGTSLAQGPREAMEDCASVVESGVGGFLYAFIFDGHSGTTAANWLNEKLYAYISDFIEKSPAYEEDASNFPIIFHEGHLEPGLAKIFNQADVDLLKFLEDDSLGAEQQAGATATVAMVRRDKIIVGNVGDSRAVLCRKGRAVDLTTEHRAYGRGSQDEVARIQAGGGWVKNGRVLDVLAVSRAFGDRDFKRDGIPRLLQQGIKDAYWTKDFADKVCITADPIIATPDVTEVLTGADDEFVVLATDGLWDVFSSDEVVQLVRKQLKKGSSPQDCADKLVQFALKRYTADNVAVIVVDLGTASPKEAGGEKKKSGGFWGFGR